MKIAIDFPIIKAASNPHSHRVAWLLMWASQLRRKYGPRCEVKVLYGDSWDERDDIYLNHGMELKGDRPNIIGGMDDEQHTKRLRRILDVDPARMVSLDRPMLDYGEFGRYRSNIKGSTQLWKDTDWDKMSDICRQIPLMEQKDLKTDWLILGDSHSFSMYMPGAMVDRNDGKTMHGAIKRGLRSFIEPYGDQVRKLTLYFGNIDVRHHLARVGGDPIDNADALIKRYREEVQKLVGDYDSIELVALLPIEHESRRIPKSTGYYEDRPFWGSRKDRQRVSDHLNSKLEDIATEFNLEFYEHPVCYRDEEGLKFEVMEEPQNVHLSRQFYRWDLDNDEKREFRDAGEKFSGLISF